MYEDYLEAAQEVAEAGVTRPTKKLFEKGKDEWFMVKLMERSASYLVYILSVADLFSLGCTSRS
jgi:hypothetical protein